MYPNPKDILTEISAPRICTSSMSRRLTATLWQHLKPDDNFMLSRMKQRLRRLPRVTSPLKTLRGFRALSAIGVILISNILVFTC